MSRYEGKFRWSWRTEDYPGSPIEGVEFGAVSGAELFVGALDALYDGGGPLSVPGADVLELSVIYPWPGIGWVTLWEGSPADVTPEWLDANAGRLWAKAEAAAREADPAAQAAWESTPETQAAALADLPF